MKKILTASILLLSLFTLSHTNSYAQDGPTKVGVGILYGDEPESAGLQVNGTFRVSPEIALAPDISVYFPDNDETAFDSFWAVNFNGHYIFNADTNYHIYGLGGLNVTSYEINDNSDSELGINLGIGAEYHLDNFSLYGELKYVISDLDQVVLGVGARFPIN